VQALSAQNIYKVYPCVYTQEVYPHLLFLKEESPLFNPAVSKDTVVHTQTKNDRYI